MDKFNRNYTLLIEKLDGTTLKVTRPFTLEFDIHRNILSSANAGQFRIYNLSPENRNQIRKDQYSYAQKRRSVSFFAGYGTNLSLAFKGDMTQALSVREDTNMITQIESYDGGVSYTESTTDMAFPRNTPQTSIIEGIAGSLKDVPIGAIGNFEGKISRGNSYSGNTIDLLNDISGRGFFIDNGKAYCLKSTECLAGNPPTINAQSGLLGTPVIEMQYINFEMLFEPSLKIGQLINLESQSAQHFNGTHKIISIKHRGVISDAVCGSATTSVGLLPGIYAPVQEVSG